MPNKQTEGAPTLLPGKYCYHVPAGQNPQEHGGFVPAVVVEDDPGYYMLRGNGPAAQPWIWGQTLDEARARADAQNRKLGLTPDDVQRITNSSIRASLKQSRR